MRALVTGGAGFVGSHLVDHLLESGDEVMVLDNLSTGARANLDPRAELIVGDVRDEHVTYSAALEAQVIYHLAARTLVPLSVLDPWGCIEANMRGTLSVLQAAQETGARVVFASSSSVYGAHEGASLETDRPAPMSPYALTKLSGEQLCALWGRLYDVCSVSLRLFNVYGPRCSADGLHGLLIPRIMAGLAGDGPRPVIYSDGSQRRDFVHVRDVARAFRQASFAASLGAGVVNIGSGESRSVLQVLQAIADGLGVLPAADRLPEREGDPSSTLADISLADVVLGWHPEIWFEDGIRELCGGSDA